jgi:hypothetical protein
MRKCLPPLLVICGAVAARVALSQPAPGDEFQVNSFTTVNQQHPRIARQLGPAGPGFIIVWDDGAGVVTVTDIFAATFNDLGIKQVNDFQVNSYVTGFQTYASVAGQYDGTFTVAWESKAQNEGNYGIYAQRVSAAGSFIGSETLVSSFTTGIQRHPSIAPGGASTRVAFEGNGAGDADGVYLSSDSFASESLVNIYTAGNQKSPSVSGNIAFAFSEDPDYLVVWSGNGPDADQGIFGHVFDAAGGSIGGDFRVNSTTSGDQTAPVVAADFFALGYVVVWETANPLPSLRDVYAQRLNANGSPRGPEFRVNTYTTGSQDQPSVAVDDHGNFVVVWSSYQDGDGRSVHAQAFSAVGKPVGTEYRLNSYTTNWQRMPSVAATGGGEGEFAVVWQSLAQEGPNSNEGIFARLFKAPLYPIGDVDGDGVVDVRDVFYLINYLFAGGPAPVGAGNVDGNATTDTQDVFYLINYLFAGGPPPV